eukprot:TRINITY_DN8676_c0_g1_i2.p1 TRINITY_DN8676_c0_g1~~TRINITY_DN8676_c0_g1_i2.p1  ORF type:complete len:661 (+),score=111.12 TRINITY_DN8676_c0_g1_i2:166-2148(+)
MCIRDSSIPPPPVGLGDGNMVMFRRREVPQNQHFLSAANTSASSSPPGGGGTVAPPKLHSPRPIHYNQQPTYASIVLTGGGSSSAAMVARSFSQGRPPLATTSVTSPSSLPSSMMATPPPQHLPLISGATSTIHRTLGSSFDCYIHNPPTTGTDNTFSGQRPVNSPPTSTLSLPGNATRSSSGGGGSMGLHQLSLSPSAYPAAKILAAGADFSPMLLPGGHTTINKNRTPPVSLTTVDDEGDDRTRRNEGHVNHGSVRKNSGAYFYSAAALTSSHAPAAGEAMEDVPAAAGAARTPLYSSSSVVDAEEEASEAVLMGNGGPMIASSQPHQNHHLSNSAPTTSLPPSTPSPAASSSQTSLQQQHYHYRHNHNNYVRRTAADDVLDLLDAILDADRTYLTRFTTVDIPNNNNGIWGDGGSGVEHDSTSSPQQPTTCQLALRHFTCWKDPSHDNKNPHLLELLARCHADKEGDFAPQQVILIDDDGNNVRAARQWGLQANKIVSRRRKNKRKGGSGVGDHSSSVLASHTDAVMEEEESGDGGKYNNFLGDSEIISICPTSCDSSTNSGDDDVWGTEGSSDSMDADDEEDRGLSDTQKMVNVNIIDTTPNLTTQPPQQQQPPLSSFKAFCCSGTGLSMAWYASQPHLQELLGVYVWEPCFDGCV